MPRTFTGRPAYGLAVTFAEDGATTEDGWTVLAREVAMADGKTALAAKDFADCVKNFTAYPHVPVTIEHADTAMPFENPPKEWREPNGHVEDLRVGKMTAKALDGTTRDVATLEGRPSYLEPTASDVAAKKWRAGSITILHDAKDEETGASLGAMLWSWSLTAHPRITGMPPVTTARRTVVEYRDGARIPMELTKHPLCAADGQGKAPSSPRGCRAAGALERLSPVPRLRSMLASCPAARRGKIARGRERDARHVEVEVHADAKADGRPLEERPER